MAGFTAARACRRNCGCGAGENARRPQHDGRPARARGMAPVARESLSAGNCPCMRHGMKTILALVDFSDVTAQVLAQAQDLAKAFGGRVIIMHVLKQEPVVLDVGLASPTVLRPPSE